MDGGRTLSTRGGAKAELRSGVVPVSHTGPACAACGSIATPPTDFNSTRAIELTFLGYPLKGFFSALDAVLMLVAIGRQKLHDLISPVGSHVTERLRREIDRLTEPKLVCVQR
jgi:hypothetical protein